MSAQRDGQPGSGRGLGAEPRGDKMVRPHSGGRQQPGDLVPATGGRRGLPGWRKLEAPGTIGKSLSRWGCAGQESPLPPPLSPPSPPSLPPSSPSSPSPRLSCPLRAARRAQSSWVKATCGHGDKTLPPPAPHPGAPQVTSLWVAHTASPQHPAYWGCIPSWGFVSRVWGAVSPGRPLPAPLCPRSHADGRDRGRGGAVQGLVLRGVRHVSLRGGCPGLGCRKNLP